MNPHQVGCLRLTTYVRNVWYIIADTPSAEANWGGGASSSRKRSTLSFASLRAAPLPVIQHMHRNYGNRYDWLTILRQLLKLAPNAVGDHAHHEVLLTI